MRSHQHHPTRHVLVIGADGSVWSDILAATNTWLVYGSGEETRAFRLQLASTRGSSRAYVYLERPVTEFERRRDSEKATKRERVFR